MKIAVQLCILPMLAMLVQASLGVSLWDKARYGMTEAELKLAYGSSLHKQQASPNEGAVMYVPFSMERKSCASTFAIEFYFDSRKRTLRSVTMSNHSVSPAEDSRQCVLAALGSKYGRPLVTDEGKLSSYLWSTPAGLSVVARRWKAVDTVSVAYGIAPKESF
jgi:hypothetical protein